MLEEGNDARVRDVQARPHDPEAGRRAARRDRDDDARPVPRLPRAARVRLGLSVRPVSRARGNARPARSPLLDAYHEGNVDHERVKAAMSRPSVYDSFLRSSPPAATRSRARCSSATSRSRCRSRKACTPHCSACTATTATGAAGRADGGLRRGLHGVALPPREDGRADDRRTTGHRRLRRRLPPLDAPQAVLSGPLDGALRALIRAEARTALLALPRRGAFAPDRPSHRPGRTSVGKASSRPGTTRRSTSTRSGRARSEGRARARGFPAVARRVLTRRSRSTRTRSGSCCASCLHSTSGDERVS